MTRRVLLLVCCWMVGLLAIHANLADSLRQRLPSLHGLARLEAYEKLYRLSQNTGDAQQMLHCLNDYIAELQKQHKDKLLSLALVLLQLRHDGLRLPLCSSNDGDAEGYA